MIQEDDANKDEEVPPQIWETGIEASENRKNKMRKGCETKPIQQTGIRGHFESGISGIRDQQTLERRNARTKILYHG